MSDLAPPLTELPVLATIACPFCSVVVPDGRYCGACGAHLEHGGAPGAQRMHAYAAFPDEPVLRLAAVTSLFPHLSHRGKTPFRAGFALFVLLLLIFSLAGASGPLIAVTALGVPLLFLVYIFEVDPYEGSYILPTAVSLLLGAGLGAGWAIIGGSYVDKALIPSFFSSLTSGADLVAGIVVPAIGVLLMCIPMLVVRRFQPDDVESLDGFVAGATGALGFTLAASIDLMSPWLSNGQLTHQSFLSNLSQVVLRGIAFPLISAMSTGYIGAAVWKTRGTRSSAKGAWITSPVVALVLALLVQIGLGFTDLAALSNATLIGIHLVALGILTLAMRIGIHHVLLHEALAVHIGVPRVCPNCTHLVPAMAFCPQCGVADRAVARPQRASSLRGSDEAVVPVAPDDPATTESGPEVTP